MKNKGWTKFHRIQFSHWVSEKKPWCDGYAWTCLYNMANHKPGKVNFRNEYIPVVRGQFVTSKLKLENTFGWTRRRLDNFLKALENDDMITYRTTNRYTVITIINYEIYQSDGKQDDIQNDKQVTNRLQTGDKQVSTNKNVNNDNNVNNEKKKEKIDSANRTILYEQIINYLNTEADKSYEPTTPLTIKLINARLKEGYSLDDFKRVIDIKVEEWKGKYSKDGKNWGDYLRPQTLFSNKFESYLNQNNKSNDYNRFDFIEEEENQIE